MAEAEAAVQIICIKQVILEIDIGIQPNTIHMYSVTPVLIAKTARKIAPKIRRREIPRLQDIFSTGQLLINRITIEQKTAEIMKTPLKTKLSTTSKRKLLS